MSKIIEKTGSFNVYKSFGCAQFSLIPPRRNEKGWITNNGAVLVEAAPGNGDKNNPSWDWNQKITFAIGVADICNLFDTVNPKASRLYHQHEGASKTLQFVPGEGKYEGTFMLNISESKNGDNKKITVPFTNGEYRVVMGLLTKATPSLIGW